MHGCILLGAHAYRTLIGACVPMLCLIWGLVGGLKAAAVHLLTQDTCLRRNLDAVLEARRASTHSNEDAPPGAGGGASVKEAKYANDSSAERVAAYLPFIALVRGSTHPPRFFPGMPPLGEWRGPFLWTFGGCVNAKERRGARQRAGGVSGRNTLSELSFLLLRPISTQTDSVC